MSYNPEGLTSIDFKLEIYSPPSGNNVLFELKEEQGNTIKLVGNSAVNSEISCRQSYKTSLVGRVITDSSCNLNRELVTKLMGNSSMEISLGVRLDGVTYLKLNSNSLNEINIYSQLQTTLKSTNYIEAKLDLFTRMITSLTVDLTTTSSLNFADTFKINAFINSTTTINLTSDYQTALNSSINSFTNLNLFQAYKTTLKNDSTITTRLKLLQDKLIKLQGTVISSFNLNLILPMLIKINSTASLDLFKEPVGLRVKLNSQLAIRFKLIPNYSLNGNNRRVYLLDESFELLGELDSLEYFKWQRRFREHDSFEIKINRYKKNAGLLGIGKHLAVKRGDIVRCGKISSRKLAPREAGKGGEVWLFGGQSGNGILEKRLALPDTEIGYDEITAPAETVIKYYLQQNLVEPEDERRKVNYLEVAKDRGRGIEVTVKGRFEKISELVKSICLLSGLGWDMEFDLKRKKFLFEVRVGEDRSGLVLAPRFDNVKLIRFEEDEFKSENVIYVSNGDKSVSIGGV